MNSASLFAVQIISHVILISPYRDNPLYYTIIIIIISFVGSTAGQRPLLWTSNCSYPGRHVSILCHQTFLLTNFLINKILQVHLQNSFPCTCSLRQKNFQAVSGKAENKTRLTYTKRWVCPPFCNIK